MRRIFISVAICLSLGACTPSGGPAQQMPQADCRIPVPPKVKAGVSVGSGGIKTSGGITFDASGNNGVLDEAGECIPLPNAPQIEIGLGF